MELVAIDFEASCLPRDGRSFPIEVGIAAAEGRRGWLIRPHAHWRDWDWSREALDLHGIDPGELDRTGMPAETVFAELRREIRGRRIVANSRLDSYWWETLALAAGHPSASPIEHVGAIALGQLLADVRCKAVSRLPLRGPTHQVGPAAHNAGCPAKIERDLNTV